MIVDRGGVHVTALPVTWPLFQTYSGSDGGGGVSGANSGECGWGRVTHRTTPRPQFRPPIASLHYNTLLQYSIITIYCILYLHHTAITQEAQHSALSIFPACSQCAQYIQHSALDAAGRTRPSRVSTVFCSIAVFRWRFAQR